MDQRIKDTQRELERGQILEILVRFEIEWVRVVDLHAQLVKLQGRMVSADRLRFHLNYLNGKGYLEQESLRSPRAGIDLLRVRATPKGVDLYDGRIAEDPGVAFSGAALE